MSCPTRSDMNRSRFAMSHRVGSQHQYRQRWIPGDIRAAVVATPKDVVARVAAPDMDPLGEYFIGRIQAVGGVTRTVVTCSIVHL